MEILKWNDSLSVKNENIDSQHKKIIELTNNLIKNSNASYNSEIVSETLRDLLLHYRTHFQDEEKLLKEKNYPKLDEHIKIHEKFIYDVAMFCKNVIEMDNTLTIKLTKFLVDWVVEHVSVDDQDYKKYL